MGRIEPTGLQFGSRRIEREVIRVTVGLIGGVGSDGAQLEVREGNCVGRSMLSLFAWSFVRRIGRHRRPVVAFVVE